LDYHVFATFFSSLRDATMTGAAGHPAAILGLGVGLEGGKRLMADAALLGEDVGSGEELPRFYIDDPVLPPEIDARGARPADLELWPEERVA
jgi:hypothetical protein